MTNAHSEIRSVLKKCSNYSVISFIQFGFHLIVNMRSSFYYFNRIAKNRIPVVEVIN